MNFDDQIRAIRYAIKELQRERSKALESNDQEWVEDTDKHIFSLEKAVETIKAMQALKLVITG